MRDNEITFREALVMAGLAVAAGLITAGVASMIVSGIVWLIRWLV